MKGYLNCIGLDYDLVEFISMRTEFVLLSASLPRAHHFRAFPYSGRSVVPYGLGLHFHINIV